MKFCQKQKFVGRECKKGCLMYIDYQLPTCSALDGDSLDVYKYKNEKKQSAKVEK